MSPASTPFAVVLGLSVLTVAADYFLKRASGNASPFMSLWFVAGVVTYTATTFGWVYVMRHMTFATIGVVYSLAIILLLTVVGVFVLGETLRWQEAAGIALAVAALTLLARFA